MSPDSLPIWVDRRAIWLNFVSSFSGLLAQASHVPTGPSRPPLAPPGNRIPNKSGTKILICSPHPDDEALTSGLALRLQEESNAEIVNCAITLGSNKGERNRRREELEASCSALGFNLVVPNDPVGLEGITQLARENSPSDWSRNVERMIEIIDQEQPDFIFFPHAEDFNPTHIGTHLLVTDALKMCRSTKSGRRVILIETEYWHQLVEPNLLVGLREETVAMLVLAVAEHGGEVSRNPYHIHLPARLVDNVRRGAEVVGGPGAKGCNFAFGELYRLSLLEGPDFVVLRQPGLIFGPDEKMTAADLLDYFFFA